MKGLTTINKVKKEQVEKRTYLAVDIGASSGRIMKSQRLANGQITIEEILEETIELEDKDLKDLKKIINLS